MRSAASGPRSPGNHGVFCASVRIDTADASNASAFARRAVSLVATARAAFAANTSSLVARSDTCDRMRSVTATCASGGRSPPSSSSRSAKYELSKLTRGARGASPTARAIVSSALTNAGTARIASVCRSGSSAASGGASTVNPRSARRAASNVSTSVRSSLASANSSRRSRIASARSRASAAACAAADTCCGSTPPFADSIMYASRTASSPARGSLALRIALSMNARCAPPVPSPPGAPATRHSNTAGSTTYASPRRSRASTAHATRDDIAASSRGSRIASSARRNGLPSPRRSRSK